jgi:hypothetical protein
MRDHRPEQFEKERREYVRASFDKILGQNARRMLTLIENEVWGVELA